MSSISYNFTCRLQWPCDMHLRLGLSRLCSKCYICFWVLLIKLPIMPHNFPYYAPIVVKIYHQFTPILYPYHCSEMPCRWVFGFGWVNHTIPMPEWILSQPLAQLLTQVVLVSHKPDSSSKLWSWPYETANRLNLWCWSRVMCWKSEPTQIPNPIQTGLHKTRTSVIIGMQRISWDLHTMLLYAASVLLLSHGSMSARASD